MSANTTDETDGAIVTADETRYAELNIGGEEYVIYDRKNHQAWIQSTVTYALDELQ